MNGCLQTRVPASSQSFRFFFSLRLHSSVITSRPGGISEWLEILAGVPQGFIRAPLLSIMFNNVHK